MRCWIVELPRFAVYHRPVSAFSGMIDGCEGLKLAEIRQFAAVHYFAMLD